MKLTTEQIKKYRYGIYTIYELYVMIDGNRITHKPNADRAFVDKTYTIQVQDGCSAKEAVTSLLTGIKLELTELPAEEDLDGVEV